MAHHQELTSLLSEISLTLDPQLSAQIAAFLSALPLPPADSQTKKLLLIAAAALKADIARVLPVGGGVRVSYGAPFEQFLHHVQGEQRADFLEAAARILQEWKEAPPQLSSKFERVRRTYSTFTHYRTLFQSLAEKARLDPRVAHRLMSAFWIAFLRAKTTPNHKNTPQIDTTQLQLLMAALELAFELVAPGITREKIGHAFCLEFGAEVVLGQSLRELYKKDYLLLLEKYQGDKSDCEESDLSESIKDEDALRRLVDNLSITFARQKGANFEQVNELYYLQLQLPPLTPNPQPHAIASLPPHTVCKVLTFDDDEQSQQNSCNNQPLIQPLDTTVNNNSSKPFELCERQNAREDFEGILSRFVSTDEQGFADFQRRRKKFVINKCHTRLLILKWVQNEIKDAQPHLQTLTKDLQLSVNLPAYHTLRIKTITALLQKLCPACKDKPHRSGQAYRLFLAFLIKVRQHIKRDDFLNIASNQNYLDAFLCLTCLIFNHAFKTQELSFRQYCQHFDVGIITGFVPLNWLGVYADMPKELQSFLFQLQEKILFDEIWRCNTGIELFSSKEPSSFVEMAIKKRLFRHVSHCISLLSKGEITEKQRCSIFKFIEQILSTRLQLLSENNLYLIIVCSINFCLGKTLPLSKLIETLRKNPHLSHLLSEAKDNYGQPTSIDDYYSHIFIRQVDPLLAARKELLLVTPTKTPPTATRNSNSSSPKSRLVFQTFNFGQDSLLKNDTMVRQIRKDFAFKAKEALYQSQLQPQAYQ